MPIKLPLFDIQTAERKANKVGVIFHGYKRRRSCNVTRDSARFYVIRAIYYGAIGN